VSGFAAPALRPTLSSRSVSLGQPLVAVIGEVPSSAIPGVIGYPVFLVGSVLAMFGLIDVTHGAGMLALVPGGLFELILPIWLFTTGFSSRQIDG